MVQDLDSADAATAADQDSLHERLVRVLVHLDGDTIRLEQLLTQLLTIRDQWTGSLGQSLASLRRVLRQRQKVELAAFAGALGTASLAAATTIVAGLGATLDDTGHPAARLAAAGDEAPASVTSSLWQAYWLAQLLTTGGDSARAPGGITRKRLFPGCNEEADAAVAELQTLYRGWHEDPAALRALERMARFAPLEDPAGQDGLLQDVLELLRFLLAELNVVIMTEGRTDFQFLAERALLSLRGNAAEGEAYSEVLLSEDRRLEHLLLDEFQDTSHTQHRLIRQLISGWMPGDGRTLFLVGDPMQSIYRFRAADVGLFTRVVQQGRMGDVPVETLMLTANFRSRREITGWINQQFPDIFPSNDERDSGAVRYHAAIAEREGGGSVQLHALAPDETDEDEARLITALIRDCRQRDDTERIAVLVRARKHLEALARELLRAGIDFEAVKVDALAGRPVIQDLLAITRALLHPADRVAVAAVLRAPWCGLRLAELHRVLGEQADGDVWQRIGQAAQDRELVAETRQRLGQLNQVLAGARELGAHLALRERVEWTWLQLGGPFAYADASELENAAEFLDLLGRVEQEGQSELVERLSEALQALYAKGQPSQLQLMTIHQAKGLEFDVVILPGLQRNTGRHDPTLIMAQQFTLDDGAVEGEPLPDSGLLMAPVTQRGHDAPSIYRYLGAVDAVRQRYESIRLLYVAATRAKKQLHLLGRFKFSEKKGCYADAGSFMQLLMPAFEPACEARHYQAGETQDAEPEPLSLPLLRLVDAPELRLEPADLQLSEAAEPPSLPDRDATALGAALHLWLELIHDHWQQGWNGAWFDQHPAMLESLLRRSGARPDRVAVLLPALNSMIKTALHSDTGRRAISPEGRAESHAELVLFKREGNRIVQRIMDRLYRDEAGRWTIVDYKTGSSGQEVLQRWQQQLSAYANLVSTLIGTDLPDCQVYQAQECRLIPLTPQDAAEPPAVPHSHCPGS
jgi:ATP-dependent exoDNAse (exonuclease V) beta subunit